MTLSDILKGIFNQKAPVVVPEIVVPPAIMPPSVAEQIGAMNISKSGLAEIAGYEGCCTAPYLDPRVWTFGIGHTAFDGIPNPALMPRGVDSSIEYCFELFQAKIGKYVARVNSAVHVPVTQAQFDALVSFDFNTGAIDKATLTQILNSGASKEEVASHFAGWNHAGGQVVDGLTHRRANEAKLFTTGLYSMHGNVTITTADIYGREMHSHAYEVNALEYIK